MNDKELMRLMIVGENILICKRNQKKISDMNNDYQRLINEFMPQLRELLAKYIDENKKDYYISSRVRIFYESNGKIKVLEP